MEENRDFRYSWEWIPACAGMTEIGQHAGGQRAKGAGGGICFNLGRIVIECRVEPICVAGEIGGA